MRIFIILALIFFGALGLTWFAADNNANKPISAEVQQNSYEGYMLPDLKITTPDELFIETKDGVKKLRFNTTFINQGESVFEVKGDFDYEQNLTMASQNLYSDDGSRLTRKIGTFEFHPDHDHWHIAEYVVFQLWEIEEKGQPVNMIASTGKMSFCIWDRDEYNLAMKGAPQQRVYDQCESETQGLSVGWSDTYRSNIEGQELNISNVSDGRYLVRSEINPGRKIIESNYDNNTVEIIVEISGDTLTIADTGAN